MQPTVQPTATPPASSQVALDPLALRRTLGAFVTGVTVITVLDEHAVPIGMTANSFNSVSLDPPLIVWSLRTNARTFGAYANARRFRDFGLAGVRFSVGNIVADGVIEKNGFLRDERDLVAQT